MLDLVSPPAIEPVSLDDAKTWLRVSHDDENALISDLVIAARSRVERHTGLALIQQGFTETLDDWAAHRLSGFGRAFTLARAPLISVDTVAIENRDGGVTNWDQSEYRIEAGEAGRLVAIYPHTLPCPEVPAGGIVISFTAGFGQSEDDVPQPLREAVLRLVGEAYGGVEPAESARRGEGTMPEAVARLLSAYTRVRL
jgi:uncharacterized phiE125 gp8 family phage protein